MTYLQMDHLETISNGIEIYNVHSYFCKTYCAQKNMDAQEKVWNGRKMLTVVVRW